MVWNPKQCKTSTVSTLLPWTLPLWQEKQHLSDGGVDVDLVLPLKFRPHGAEGELIDPRSWELRTRLAPEMLKKRECCSQSRYQNISKSYQSMRCYYLVQCKHFLVANALLALGVEAKMISIRLRSCIRPSAAGLNQWVFLVVCKVDWNEVSSSDQHLNTSNKILCSCLSKTEAQPPEFYEMGLCQAALDII